jgi:serine/threonine protein kinase
MSTPTTISHYTIEGELGRGAMGVVYLALDARLHRHVAIKSLPESLLADAAWRARIQREARILASMNHPNVAAIFGLEEVEGAAYLVLELADGPTLAEMLRKARSESADSATSEGLPLKTALRLGIQIASGIGAAHDRGVIHRDLKPANVKVRTDGLLKVLDFGIAKTGIVVGAPDAATLAAPPSSNDRPVSSFGAAMLGTPGYFSPEQARGKPVSRATDLWAFGAVLFEMLTGRKACPGDTLADIVVSTLVGEPEYDALPRETPAPVRQLLRRCMVKDSRERLDSFAEARAALEQALDEALGSVAFSVSNGAPTPDPAPSNLPDEPHRLIARTAELHAIAQSLAARPLTTLIGPPGAGASRLALRAAAAFREEHPGRAWWLDVPAGATAPFLERLAALELGARFEGFGAPHAAIARLLGARPALLILDGCDGARSACADLAARLTRAAPSLRILAAGRSPLGLAGEAALPLAGLPAPSPDDPTGPFAAAAFFVDRAARAPGGFNPSSANAPHIARLCESLRGLPLAVELVAARVGSAGGGTGAAPAFDRFAQRVTQRLNLGLNSGLGSPDERTLSAVADWALEQTLHNHRRLLERLSLLSGWFDVRLAAAVAGASPAAHTTTDAAIIGPYTPAEWDVLRLLESLAERALLAARNPGTPGAPRHAFRLPAAVRTAALAGLHQNEGPANPARIIATHAAAIATHAADRLTRPDAPLWRSALHDRLPLLHDAQQLAANHDAAGEAERIRAALERFWSTCGL